MRKLKTLLFCCLGLVVIFCATEARAGVRIDKPKIRLAVEPGSYDSGEIKVENTGAEQISIKVYLEDWVYSEQEGGKDFMPKGTSKFSASPWISFYPADFTIVPNGTQMVRYTVSVPKEAKGGHYSVMFFETGGGAIEQPDEQGVNVAIQVLNRLGALFYVEPQGTIDKIAAIKGLDISEKLNDLTVTADFLNTGNTDITASGTFDVIDQEGFVYARGLFEEVYTLGGDKAKLQAKASSVNLRSGDYDLLMTLEFQNGGSLIQEAHFSVSGDSITSIKIKE
ncbi:MAG: hypothetical protein V1863_02500 [Candidatus Omnitrophota bacterium]